MEKSADLSLRNGFFKRPLSASDTKMAKSGNGLPK